MLLCMHLLSSPCNLMVLLSLAYTFIPRVMEGISGRPRHAIADGCNTLLVARAAV
jgi:hypothetical protein